MKNCNACTEIGSATFPIAEFCSSISPASNGGYAEMMRDSIISLPAAHKKMKKIRHKHMK